MSLIRPLRFGFGRRQCGREARYPLSDMILRRVWPQEFVSERAQVDFPQIDHLQAEVHGLLGLRALRSSRGKYQNTLHI